jgi:hypothetical protein
MSTSTLNGHQTQNSSWHTLAVRDFFGQIPWTGIPAPNASLSSGIASIQAADAEVTPNNLQMTVSDFFQQFPWNGVPQIAAPIAAESFEAMMESSSDGDFTLDGFADMF